MTTIIRTQSEVPGATTAQLVATYNALTGKSIKKFENRAVAERRVVDAIMAAADAAGHLGVPPETEPPVLTREELVKVAEVKGKPAPVAPSQDAEPEDGQGAVEVAADATDEDEVVPASDPVGQAMLRQLEAIAATARITPQPKPKREPKSNRRPVVMAVRATFAGRSKPQAASTRNAVLLHIQAAHPRAVTVEELEAHFQQPCRGYLQKLLDRDHLEIVHVAAAQTATMEAA